jgi:AcrR family transcriptional regulator
MRRLGSRVGTSRMAAYHHFTGKDEMLAAVGEDGFRRLLERLQTASAKGATPLERLRAALIAYVRFAVEETDLFRLMFANLLDRPLHIETVEELRATDFSSHEAFAAFNVLLSAVKHCQSEGVFRPGDPLVIADTLHAFIHGVARLAIDNHLKCPCGLEDFVNRGLDALFRGLGGNAPGRSALDALKKRGHIDGSLLPARRKGSQGHGQRKRTKRTPRLE